MRNRYTPPRAPVELPAAPMSATRSGGVRTVASKVTRTAGVSWTGTQLRAWIAWDCEKRKGCRFPAVCAGASHWRPDAPGPRRVVDAHAVVAGPQRDREGRAEDRVRGPELPGGAGIATRAAGLRAADLERPRVEPEDRGRRVAALEMQGRRSAERPGRKSPPRDRARRAGRGPRRDWRGSGRRGERPARSRRTA